MAVSRRPQRTLRSIDNQLCAADPCLASLFGAFSELAADAAMPGHERLPGRVSRLGNWLWEALATSARLAAAMPDATGACPAPPQGPGRDAR